MSATATGPVPFAAGLPERTAQRAIRRHLACAIGLSAILVFGIGGWASFTTIAGAVIAPGQLVVESDVKKVQHPTGGVVGQLLVREGSKVKAGDVVIRLDETQARANLDIVLKALDELSARRARDEAERDASPTIAFPPDLLRREGADPAIARLIDGETKLFVARLSARAGQKSQLQERIKQLTEEITGLTQQVVAKDQEIKLITTELKGVRDLFSRDLVPFARVTALERDCARIQGERGQLVASTASTKGKISEIRLQIIQIDQDTRTELGKDLAEIRGKWSELVERRIAAEDMLKRVEMRAPQDGIVHQLTVHTIGGLVTSNEPAMLIVPVADQLQVEIRVQPQDIDTVRVGQKATLRFSAFNTRTTPEIDGIVTRVSADVAQDQRSGLTYYTARIALTSDEQSRLGEVRLVPGMPVEAFMQIGDRSVLSYLLKPLADQLAKSWRER